MTNHHGTLAKPSGWRYTSADLTMAGGKPFWAIHATDPASGTTGTWIAGATFSGGALEVRFNAWIPDALQALTAGRDATLWGVTAQNLLVTNTVMHGLPGWSVLPPAPELTDSPWFFHELRFIGADGIAEPSEVVDCLLWTDAELLIGTFSRRIYSWRDDAARLEEDRHAGLLAGGMNDLVETEHSVFALGYGGTLLRRDHNVRHWQEVDVPWSSPDAQFVNLIAGTVAPGGTLHVVVDGGWVLVVDDRGARVTHRLDAKPLGLATFQGDLYVATMDGCFELLGDGTSRCVQRHAGLGKIIDAGAALFAIDAAPDHPDAAALHVWLRTRTADRWTRHTVA